MDKLHHVALYVLFGMPVWAWSIVAVLVGLNEAITRGKWTRAQSVFQGAIRFALAIPALGTMLGKFPYLGDALKWCAGITPLATVEGDALKAAQAAVDKQKGSISVEWMLAIAAAALFVLAVVGSGCATPGAQALGKCELGSLPQATEPVIAAAGAILGNTSDINWAQDLSLLAPLAGGQLNCIVAAITAAAQAQMPAHGQPTPMLLTVIQRGQIWAKAHPAKCCAAKPVSSAAPMTYGDPGDVAVFNAYPFSIGARE